jgi:hypothetical protein
VTQEIVTYLVALAGSEVEIVLEIEARRPKGFDGEVQRVVRENARTLKVDAFEFEP